LRCPFGCRQHHRRQRSSERSTAYYQTVAGKRKKKRLNNRRHRSAGSVDCPQQQEVACQPTAFQEQRPDESSAKAELRLDEVVLRESSLRKSPMLPYVRMLVRLIERVRLSCHAIVNLLRRAVRQHSMAYQRRTDYVLRFLHQHPP
jgi:hypothetical protein